MGAAVFYQGSAGDSGRPVGIDVATETFLTAFIRHGSQETLYGVCPDRQAFRAFQERVRAAGGDPRRCAHLDPTDGDALAQADCLFRYDPAIIDAAWIRRRHGQKRYSLCGITHTSSTDTVMDIAGGFLTAPVQSWDALVCASHSIKSAILALMEGWRDYLGQRLGGSAPCPMELPVIPLGVDTARFATMATPEARQRQRQRLELSGDAIALLFVGRLSHYAKANPIALLLGAEAAARRTEKPVHLLLVGYFADEMAEEAFREAAQALATKCRVHFIDTGDPAYPDGLWAAADIFCSFSDNIQESFGLTPVEAMASGLPVVVGDWDGYRDTVRDGIDGITIPTLMPGPGAGDDLAFRYFTGADGYGDYLAGAAQATAIPPESVADALSRLVENETLRKEMGEAGRVRAGEVFDWRHVIGAYEALWAELAERRAVEPEIAPPGEDDPFYPLRPDPFRMFAAFASHALDPQGRMDMALDDWDQALKRISLKVNLFNADALIDLEDLPLLIGQLEVRQGERVTDIVNSVAHLPRARLMRTLGWLVKLGICRYYPPRRLT